jgi:NAD(P)H dehydrogenase (quinone)
MPKVLILYYSTYGHTERMAAAAAEGAASLAGTDAIIIGVPTRYGRMPARMANFLDQTGSLWAQGRLEGRVGSVFASTATQHGGQEITLFSVITTLLHFGMIVVGLPYSAAGQMRLDEITGGSPYGATTIAGGRGERQPSQNELDLVRAQGRRVAEITAHDALRPRRRGAGVRNVRRARWLSAGTGS